MRRTPSPADFAAFAALSGDFNPIHVDPAFSAVSGFGRIVAHGAMLTGWLLADARAADPGLAVSVTAARFSAPTYAGEAVETTREDAALVLRRVADRVETCRLVLNGPAPEVDGAERAFESAAGVRREATLERTFSADDVAALHALTGEAARTDAVPEALVIGLFSTLLGMDLPGRGTNWLKQETAWIAAARVGEPLRARVAVVRMRADKRLVDLSTTCTGAGGRAIATGRALVSARDVAGVAWTA